MGWLNNDVKTEDFCCNGATNGKSIQEVKDPKTQKKLSFDFEIIFEFVMKKKLQKMIVNFKDFKIVVV